MKRLLALGAALAAALAIGVTSVIALAAPLLTHTVQITGNVDSGHNGYWAYENFARTVSITKNSDGTYAVLLTDKGTFTTIPGAHSPRQGISLPQVSGTFTGWYKLTVTSPGGGPSASGVAASYDYQCDPNANCPGRPSSTTNWPLLYFPKGATVAGGDYNWTYTTDCEKWVDASSNNDGMDAGAGDITGKDCSTPTPSPSSMPTTPPTSTPPSPSGSGNGGGTVTAAPAGTTPGLPDTGFAPVHK